ncbi:hypothetical protein MBRA_02236 [Methylobacterium brachiatum]|nr:hypothetical protein MBRA_02236 [Methylobacterium brachiatum]
MGDPVAPARLQHAGTAGHPDHLSVGIAEPDRPALDLREGPDAAGGDHRGDQAGIGQQHPVPDRAEPRHLVGQPDMDGLERRDVPGRVLRQGEDRPAALHEAEQRQDRHQHCDRQEPGRGAPEGRLQPQPEIQSGAAVNPGDDQHRRLHRALMRRRDPEGVEFLRVALLEPLGGEGDPGAHDVADQQRRDQQTGDHLHDLAGTPAEVAGGVERLEPEQQVDHQRAVEQGQAQRVEPQRGGDAEAVLHGVEGDVAERVVGQVGQDVGEQDQPAPEPEAAQGQTGPDPDAQRDRGGLRASGGGSERRDRRGARHAGGPTRSAAGPVWPACPTSKPHPRPPLYFYLPASFGPGPASASGVIPSKRRNGAAPYAGSRRRIAPPARRFGAGSGAAAARAKSRHPNRPPGVAQAG